MIPMTDPESFYEEDFHRHTFHNDKGDSVAVIEFDDIEDEKGGLWCEVTAYARLHGNEPIIAYQRTNLIATRGGLSTIVTKLADIGSLHWEGGFDIAQYRTVKQYRSDSSTSEWMERRVATEDDNPYLLEPFIARTGVTVLFAPRGSSKSTFALKLAHSVASGEGIFGRLPAHVGPVMYLDFEDTARPHEFRLSAMTDGDIEGLIKHVRITKSLKDTRRMLRKMVRDEDIALVVLDSVALARAADVSGSEATIKMFKTLAQLGVPVLAIDHMTKEDNKRVATGQMDARQASPIGSQFTESSARLAWFMNVLPQSTATKKVFNLHNTKNNHGPQSEPIGMTLEITQGEHQQMETATFEMQSGSHEAIVMDEMSMKNPQKLLVWHFKQQRDEKTVIPMTLKEMEASGIKYGSLSSIVTTKFSDWWEQLKGSKQYILTPEGLENAMMFAAFLSSGEVERPENG